MKISTYIIKKKIQKLSCASSSDREKHSIGIEEARSVLILGDWKDYERIYDIAKRNSALKGKVSFCMLVNNDLPKDSDKNICIVDSKKDINNFYIPNQDCIEKVTSIKADILIDLSSSESYSLKYILLNHPSTFKVGVKNENADLYDLSILMTESNNIEQNFEQILFYLNSIRSK